MTNQTARIKSTDVRTKKKSNSEKPPWIGKLKQSLNWVGTGADVDLIVSVPEISYLLSLRETLPLILLQLQITSIDSVCIEIFYLISKIIVKDI